VQRGDAWCGVCGVTLDGAVLPLELVLGDGTHVALDHTLEIGRAAENSVRIQDPSVSRSHARILVSSGGPRLEDAGSSHGTFLDGRQISEPVALADGARIKLGDVELTVRRRASDVQPNRTIVVGSGTSVLVPAVGQPAMRAGTNVGLHPKVRRGWALKRLDVAEGRHRWVLRDLRGGRFLRFDDEDAALFQLIDGEHSLVDLIGEAERRWGTAGASRLARLLADLGERGLLEGVSAGGGQERPPGLLAKLMTPREKAWKGAGDFVDRLYKRGGWVLFTRPAIAAICALGLFGLVAFIVLLTGRYGTPFVVADKLAIGGLVFLVGRFLLVAVHELAHALTMASFGRRVSRAGVKTIFIIPFAFVDTSEAWFEPRRRRMAVSAAGPLSDLAIGGMFALTSLALPAGNVRDICFQVALGGYLGACFNLNPFLDRDGYHLAVDALQQPGLRTRARAALAARLRGRAPADGDEGLVLKYGAASIAWLFVVLGFVGYLTHRYSPILDALAPRWVVIALLAVIYLALLVPIAFTIGRPLQQRRAALHAEVNRVLP
jgi:putative peptide zinc metalloprotease protein